MHIFLLGPVMMFYKSWKYRMNPDPLLIWDITKVRFLEGTLEAAPQILLQVYIFSKCVGSFQFFLAKKDELYQRVNLLSETLCPKSVQIASLISIPASFVSYLWVVTEKKKNDYQNQLSRGTVFQIYLVVCEDGVRERQKIGSLINLKASRLGSETWVRAKRLKMKSRVVDF